MKILFVPLLILIAGCASLSTQKLSQDIFTDIEAVCVNGTGKGRLLYGSQRFLFSFQSALDSEKASWVIVFDFPLQDEEFVELDWSEKGNSKFESSLDNKLLTRKDVDPILLERFTTSLRNYMQDIIALKSKTEKTFYKWQYQNESLVFKNNLGVSGRFTNYTSEKYFGLVKLKLSETDRKMGLDLTFTSCEKG